MKNLKGGYNILDISDIALEETESAASISDKGILDQLLALYPYSKNEKANILKPIYLKYKLNNGYHVLLASLSNIYDGIQIDAVAKDYKISLVVTYEEDQETQLISIYSAKYTVVFKDTEVTDLVNSAIESGDIEIPTGGTKLYKHIINFNDEFYTRLEFIATFSTEITNYDLYKQYIAINANSLEKIILPLTILRCIFTNTFGSLYNVISFGWDSSKDVLCCGCSNEGSISISLTSGMVPESFTDTVTEL